MDIQDAVKVRRNLGDFLFDFRDCIQTRPSRRLMRTYVEGQLSGLARKSIEPMALDAGVAPRTLQEFLSNHRWDEEAVRCRTQKKIQQEHGDPEAIGVIDETGNPKKGNKTVGVQRQYCGTTGKIDNCVVSVHLGIACNDDFHALVDGDVYISEQWLNDPERRREARIPDHVQFRTKLEIAIDLIDRAINNGVHFKWMTADELYGRSSKFRKDLANRGIFYVLDIPCDLTGWTKKPKLETVPGRNNSKEEPKIRVAPGERKARRVDSLWERGGPTWQHFRVKETHKGPDVWNVRVTRFFPREDGLPGQSVFLIIAENVLTYEKKYFLAHAPPGTSVEIILYVAFSRWHIERLFQDSKGEIGMDHFEVRNYVSLARHLILSMLSILFLVSETKRLKKKVQKLPFVRSINS